MERCCGFTIETGGVIVATKHAVQMLCAIFFLGFDLIFLKQYFGAVEYLVRFLLLILAIGILCISLLSIRGIEIREHRYIIPMMIWLVIAVVISFALLIVYVVQSHYISASVFVVVIGLFWMALDVFGIFVVNSLLKKYREQPRFTQYNQQPLQ